MSVVQDVLDTLSPFLPFLQRVGDRAADEVGADLPGQVARALPLLARKYAGKDLDESTLRSDLEQDPVFREQLAKALDIQVTNVYDHGTSQQNTFHGDVNVSNGDLVLGAKTTNLHGQSQ